MTVCRLSDRLLLWTLTVAAAVLLAPSGLAQQPVTFLPSGSIFWVNATTCPAGSAEFTNARGAYVVGLVSSGTLNTLVGTRLTNQENRPTGSHTHTITDPGHVHGGIPTIAGDVNDTGGFNLNVASGTTTTGSITTGITINAGGGGTSGQTGVAGTNLPYIQLLTCATS